MYLSYDQPTALMGIQPRERETYVQQKLNIHNNFIDNSQKLETILMSFVR